MTSRVQMQQKRGHLTVPYASNVGSASLTLLIIFKATLAPIVILALQPKDDLITQLNNNSAETNRRLLFAGNLTWTVDYRMIETGAIFFARTEVILDVFSASPPAPLSTRLLYARGYRAIAFLGQGAVRCSPFCWNHYLRPRRDSAL